MDGDMAVIVPVAVVAIPLPDDEDVSIPAMEVLGVPMSITPSIGEEVSDDPMFMLPMRLAIDIASIGDEAWLVLPSPSPGPA